MKTFLLLCLSLLLTTAKMNAQEMEIEKGKDTVVCVVNISGVTSPIAALNYPRIIKGTAPYTYVWIVVGQPGKAAIFMDDSTRPNPNVSNIVGDSADFALKITDSKGGVAYDTIRVYNSKWTIASGECVHYKLMNQTITLSIPASSNFPPYSYIWSPATELSDDKVASPTTWATKNTVYDFMQTDAKNCRIRMSCTVNIIPTGITQLAIEDNTSIIYPNPVSEKSKLVIGEKLLGSRFKIFSVDGRVVYDADILFTQTTIFNVASLVQGVYLYTLEKKGIETINGKFTVE